MQNRVRASAGDDARLLRHGARESHSGRTQRTTKMRILSFSTTDPCARAIHVLRFDPDIACAI